MKNKKFLFVTLNQNIYSRQKYILDLLEEHISIDTIFLEDIYKKYAFFYIPGYYINSFWPDSYSFSYWTFKKIFLENIELTKYSGIIVTFDWSASIRRVLQIANEYRIPSFNILHEGFYLDIQKWYNMNQYLPIKLILKSQKNLDVPISDYNFVWWENHKTEFLRRGCEKSIKCIGTLKFEKYKFMVIQEKELRKNLGIKGYDGEKIFLYAFQILEESKIHYQYKIINDLIEYCSGKNTILIIRNQLGYKLDISKITKYNKLYIDGITQYGITAEEAILLADSVFAINSTMLLEAIVNKKDAFSFKYFDFISPFLDENSVKHITNKIQIESQILASAASDFQKGKQLEIQKKGLQGDISIVIDSLRNHSKIIKNHDLSKVTMKKKYFLKYFYLLFNPFLIKNFIQATIIFIKVKLGKIF